MGSLVQPYTHGFPCCWEGREKGEGINGIDSLFGNLCKWWEIILLRGGKEKLPFRTVKVSGGKKRKRGLANCLEKGALLVLKRGGLTCPVKRHCSGRGGGGHVKRGDFPSCFFFFFFPLRRGGGRGGGVCCCFSRGSDEKVRSFRTETQVLKFANATQKFHIFPTKR